MRILFWGIALLGALIAVDFAASNTQFVSLKIWPLSPPYELELPLYLLVILFLFVGFFAGRIVAWIGGRRWRREAKERGQRIEALERELAAQRSRLEGRG
jgi:uncharacterized integral membrane protein